ncbi:hypothetical protein [Thalassospira sp.]|uniref:hypothetical protein n=1 Tax=Thalassospira sp. TaxID=1912094 RepID=UPI002733BC10|nr:hypothetical protein [Thalassospira sp.]MDP2697068.1 hypothetical protein [Thalassospira sp.]
MVINVGCRTTSQTPLGILQTGVVLNQTVVPVFDLAQTAPFAPGSENADMFFAFCVYVQHIVFKSFLTGRQCASKVFSDFLKKVLALFFSLWHNRKINGANAPGPKPARLVPCGFLRLGQMKETMMQRQNDRQIGKRNRMTITGGWKSHYGGSA